MRWPSVTLPASAPNFGLRRGRLPAMARLARGGTDFAVPERPHRALIRVLRYGKIDRGAPGAAAPLADRRCAGRALPCRHRHRISAFVGDVCRQWHVWPGAARILPYLRGLIER